MGKLTVSKEDMFTYDELYDAKTRSIAQDLAQALNQNSAARIKELKYLYADCKEFVKAKKVLEKKCKEVWNPFSDEIYNLPSDAMKSLGITNQPSLEFLLSDSIKYFEKTNGSMTAQIIGTTLNNKNLRYTIDDIHAYLSKLHKEGCIFNQNTALYLIKKHNYNSEKLRELGIDVKQATKKLSVSEYFRYLTTNLKSKR